MKKITLLLLIALPTTLSLSAQSITGDDVKNQFIKEWERSKAYTLDYLNTMPADKYSFKAMTASAALPSRCSICHPVLPTL